MKALYERLLKARRPFDFFGKVLDEEELKKKYKEFSKKIHPDALTDAKDKYIAGEAFSLLSGLYAAGKKELAEKKYGVTDPAKLYEGADPLFEVTIGGTEHRFYENIYEGEMAYIYKGIASGEPVFLKMAISPDDNAMMDTEYDVLSAYKHQSLPYVENKIEVNGSTAILMREVKGTPMEDLMQEYPKGIPAEHVMWMMERLLGVVGYLHSNCVVHGNIKPDNIIINRANHNVSLTGFSFCIPEANKEDAGYKIINDFYTAPEVDASARVMPQSDIYSIGKVAVTLLGGSAATGGMPLSADPKVRAFIRKLMSDNSLDRPGDAWKLWDELIALRTEVFGSERFKPLT